MTYLFSQFSTREIATLFWLSILLVIGLFHSNTKRSVLDIGRILLDIHIFPILILLLIYTICLLILLFKIHLWNFDLTKDTLFWLFGFVICTFLQMSKTKNRGFFKALLKDIFTWSLLVEFIVNLYTFNIVLEILLIPFTTFLAISETYTNNKKPIKTTYKDPSIFLNIVGICYMIYAFYMSTVHYELLFTISNGKSIIVIAVLSALMLPFYYTIAVWMQYEVLGQILKIHVSGKVQRKWIILISVISAKGDIQAILCLQRNIHQYKFLSGKQAKDKIKEIVRLSSAP